jgi:hypothetical protein
MAGINFNGTINQSDIIVNGSAHKLANSPDNKVQLLATNHGWGSAWWDESVDLSKDWSSAFLVNAFNGSGTSDGFTFVINGDPKGTSSLGDGGQNLGFFGYDSKGGVKNSYAVLFDMWTTGPVSLLGFSKSDTSAIPSANINLPIGLANNSYVVQISYSASRKVLSASVGGKTYEQSVDLQSVVGNSGYLGFTAANGGGTLDTDISNWTANVSKFGNTPIIRGNSLYTIVDGLTWTQAEANSVKLGGHLVTIESKEEDIYLARSLYGIPAHQPNGGDTTSARNVYFIGLRNETKGRDTNWASGSSSPYRYYDTSYNNSTQFNPGVFVVSSNHTGETGHWVSVDNNSSFYKGWGWKHYGISETPFIRRGDSAYVIVEGPTWEEAEANAVALGGHLVTINDAEENEWISRNYNQKGDLSLYIGLHQGAGGSWMWSDDYAGEGYQNWHPGQPSPGETIAEIILGDLGWANDPNPTGFLNNVPNPSPYASRGLAEIKLAPNNNPTGTPTLSGDFKAGQIITIDKTPIQDADNFTGYTPDFKYSWEVSSNGSTWTPLTTADATDNNATYTLTTAEVGKQVRGVVSYLDGYGTNEVVASNSSLIAPLTPTTQEVFTSKTQIGYSPSKNITVPLQYRTSTGDSQLSGLTLNVHYNSNVLTPGATNNGVSDQIPAAITSTKVIQDTNDLDNDPLTDKIIQMVWATFDNTFPNKTLPTTLANVTFNTSSQTTDPVTGEPLTTTLRYTASETASEYDFITNSTTLKATTFTLDVDGDGQVKALTDGLMVIRKLLGPAFDGDALTFKAIGSGATRTTDEIHDYIQSGIDSGLLDVDKNGKTTALTDGLMVIRRLLGPAFDGEALTFKALASDSPYFGPPADFIAVASNIDSLLPTVI